MVLLWDHQQLMWFRRKEEGEDQKQHYQKKFNELKCLIYADSCEIRLKPIN